MKAIALTHSCHKSTPPEPKTTKKQAKKKDHQKKSIGTDDVGLVYRSEIPSPPHTHPTLNVLLAPSPLFSFSLFPFYFCIHNKQPTTPTHFFFTLQHFFLSSFLFYFIYIHIEVIQHLIFRLFHTITNLVRLCTPSSISQPMTKAGFDIRLFPTTFF